MSKKYGTGQSHQKIVNYSKNVSLDNVNNRLLKHIIKKIYNFIKDNEKLKSKADTSIKLIKNILYDLDEVKDIQSISEINIDNSIIMNYEYFSLLKLYNNGFKFVDGLSTHIDEDDFIKSISKIFELYCFENIKKLLEEIEFENGNKISFKESKTKVIKEEINDSKRGKNKKQHSYVSHEDFIKDKFADKSKGIDTEGFLETDFKGNKLRLILGDIYHRGNVIFDFIEYTENKIDTILKGDNENINIRKSTETNLLYPVDYREMDYSGIFGDEFNFCKLSDKGYKYNKDLKMPTETFMTPDLSIEIRDKNSNFITKTIIFDAKFSAIFDELTGLETPNKERFTELQKYKKIGYIDSEGVFQAFLENPIMIMYPGNITSSNLVKFKTVNNILKQTNNMLLIPIYSEQNDKVKEYIKGLLKEEISKYITI